ncbi:hypothetical protein KKC83_05260 [Patescibacteria group bacterium]|nr:hypothetical protein [Candidatus Falkowbacteria bacterium]MBU3906512.1 hypothetical protein [Patescibacteria group bacterium]MBU4014906.1 hypothetical protein [Patescibacteria group bacterium]MBU4026925.1 hypothetical protein [Patescibacteria group bacterium]MBU4073651.1 hypothetical protein [Patescibacteria group bacterium]
MAAGAIKTVYKKARKKRNYNGRKTFQTKSSKVVCANPYCSRIVAPSAPQVKTSKGVMHYECVTAIVFKKLEVAGLPRPTVFSLGRDFQKYLVDQANMLLLQPVENAEYKLTEVLDISEEIFGKQIKLSKLMTKQSQELSP